MTVTNNKELLKRIAGLARQNQELEENVRKLEKINEKLVMENERINALHKKLSPGVVKEGSLKFNMATVLFADIHGFSRLTEGLDSSAVMDELDEIQFEFDAIARRYKIEKIKTIGDTYMCAGGIPAKNITNPVDVVMAAMEMRNFLAGFENNLRSDDKRIWELKVGIHTGPVTAAISGKKKVNYDLKGDTVNTANRVETVSGIGMIIISVMTYELVKEFFDCEYFGKLPVKYKGDLQMYKVIGLKPDLSAYREGVLPNESFRIKFGLIQFTDIQEIILDKLEKELPDYLYYHNVKHTVDVVTEVELIGWAEGCTDEEILVLKTAALFHDAGHTIAYDNHEYFGAQLAREMLPLYNYTSEQIEQICSIIMATRLPPKPTNLLDEELKVLNKMGSLNDWNKIQVKFISGHQYFTETAISLREVNKQLQIERIQSLITE
jgi:adenylate cyclase